MASEESEDTQNKTASDNTQEKAEKLLAEKKVKLKKDIQHLKALKFQAECSLNITKFKNILEKEHSPKPLDVTKQLRKKVPDVEIELGCKLYKLSGMFCDKFLQDEYVFKFSSSAAEKKNNIYAVQVLNYEERMKVGKWFMPLGWNMDEVLSETPLDDTSTGLKNFLKNCKQRVDSYTERMEQYEKLKVVFDEARSCSLDANLMFTQIRVKLFGVKDKQHEEFHNVVLYLLYKSKGIKPFKLKIDLDDMKLDPLSNEKSKKLRSYFKSFKHLHMEEAFEKTINNRDAEFQWDLEADSPVEQNNSSSSERETNLSKLKRKREKSRNARSKRRKMEETSRNSRHSVHSQHEETLGENNLSLRTSGELTSTKSPENVRKNSKPGPSRSKIKSRAAKLDVKSSKITDGETTTRPPKTEILPKKTKDKLRQSTLTFGTENAKNSDETKNDKPTYKIQSVKKGIVVMNESIKRQNTQKTIYTSTPAHHDKQRDFNFTIENATDISNIESSNVELEKKHPTKMDKIEEKGNEGKSESSSSDSELENLENKSKLLRDLAAAVSKPGRGKSVNGRGKSVIGRGKSVTQRGKSATQKGKSVGRGKTVDSAKRGKKAGKR